jgi:hypothetical protein
MVTESQKPQMDHEQARLPLALMKEARAAQTAKS